LRNSLVGAPFKKKIERLTKSIENIKIIFGDVWSIAFSAFARLGMFVAAYAFFSFAFTIFCIL